MQRGDQTMLGKLPCCVTLILTCGLIAAPPFGEDAVLTIAQDRYHAGASVRFEGPAVTVLFMAGNRVVVATPVADSAQLAGRRVTVEAAVAGDLFAAGYSVTVDVAATGLRQPALWISRPPTDQRSERDASGGWPDIEIDAQANTVARALSNSENGQLVQLRGLFHVDFTDLPAIQPVIGWLGQSGPAGVAAAHSQINALTIEFFDAAFDAVVK